MMLEEKVRAVEDVFEKLDQEISSFQSWSGLHCKWGCGKCCFKPDIEASVLEFLPFAYHLYHQDKAFEWLEKLKNNDSSICLILNPDQTGAGLCSAYKHRGLICRLFGYSARINKYGVKELITCQIIKTEQSKSFKMTEQVLAEQTGSPVSGNLPKEVPVMNQYYMQLHAIDFSLAQEFFPINKAIKRAIEVILHYYAYRS